MQERKNSIFLYHGNRLGFLPGIASVADNFQFTSNYFLQLFKSRKRVRLFEMDVEDEEDDDEEESLEMADESKEGSILGVKSDDDDKENVS